MPRTRFRYIPHTAEVAFIAYGSSFSKVMENAAAAMLNIMLDLKKIRRINGSVEKLNISASGDSREELVWRVLQKILTKVDASALNAFDFSVVSVNKEKGKYTLKGNLLYRRSSEDCSLLEIKGVTPHMLFVGNKGKSWKVRVVVDV